MKKHKKIFILALFFMAGCQKKENTDTPKHDAILNCYPDQKSSDISRYITIHDAFSFGQDQEALFSNVHKMVMTSHHIYILDRMIDKGVLMFQKNGAFVREIGRHGKGPNEFQKIWDFQVIEEDNRIYLLSDLNPSKITSLDLNGKVISSLNQEMNLTSMHVFKENNVLFELASLNQSNKNYFARKTSEEFSLEPYLFTENENQKKSFTHPVLSGFKQANNEIFIRPSHSNRIFEASDKTLEIKYEIDIKELSPSYDGHISGNPVVKRLRWNATKDHLIITYLHESVVHGFLFNRHTNQRVYQNLSQFNNVDISPILLGATTCSHNGRLYGLFPPMGLIELIKNGLKNGDLSSKRFENIDRVKEKLLSASANDFILIEYSIDFE